MYISKNIQRFVSTDEPLFFTPLSITMTKLKTVAHPFNSDLFTPVELYLSLRNKHRKTCLLESNDYHNRQESKSFIGLDPIVEIELNDYQLKCTIDGKTEIHNLHKELPMSIQFQDFLNKFEFDGVMPGSQGFFGRFGFEYTLLNEKHIEKMEGHQLGFLMRTFFIFNYVLVIDHFQDQGTLLKTSFDGAPLTKNEVNSILGRTSFVEFPFELKGEEIEGKTQKEYERLTKKALDHLNRGDVFQIVLSNDYQQKFFGDDFAIYRTLRRLNPSPFLFYFDFESYHLFGSSPEAQLKIEKGIAEIHPIAGTELRTGDDDEDAASVERLKSDEKENAEHTMLVDLARNDLSRSCKKVKINKYKEVQAFSHVFHLVSIVTGEMNDPNSSIETFSHSFPAGTGRWNTETKSTRINCQVRAVST